MVVPFGALFGVIATEAGLDLLKVLSFSTIIIAGASQFAALSLMEENAPAIIVIMTALAVNLRMAMYSATLAPFLSKAPFWHRAFMAYGLFDLNFLVADQRFRERDDWSVSDRAAWFAGTSIVVIIFWIGATYAGAVLGQNLPEWVVLDFALPMTFIAMIAPAVRTLPHVAAATASVVFALLFSFVPLGLGLLIAAVLAMIIGAELERRLAA